MTPDQPPAGGTIDFAALLAVLRASWRLIVLCVVVALAVAIVYLHVATYRYAVEMRVAPVAGTSGDGVSSKLSQLGGLAAVAGVSLPDSGGSGSFKLFVEALHSRDVAEIMARDPVLMHRVFAREWDARTRTWLAPYGFVHDHDRDHETATRRPRPAVRATGRGASAAVDDRADRGRPEPQVAGRHGQPDERRSGVRGVLPRSAGGHDRRHAAPARAAAHRRLYPLPVSPPADDHPGRAARRHRAGAGRAGAPEDGGIVRPRLFRRDLRTSRRRRPAGVAGAAPGAGDRAAARLVAGVAVAFLRRRRPPASTA